MSGAQARLPGTLPTPIVARRNFNAAHSLWRSAARELANAADNAKEARKRHKAALATAAALADDFEGAKEGADEGALRAVLQAEASAEDAAETLENAGRIRSQAHKAEREAYGRRARALSDLRAVQRGER